MPAHIVQLILCVHAGFQESGPDRCIWKLTANGKFSVKTAYGITSTDDDPLMWSWNFIWKLHIPIRIKTFLWVLCHKKLLTNVQRQKRGLGQDTSCPRCSSHVESLDHLFIDCSTTQLIGKDFWEDAEVPNLSLIDFDSWLLKNLKSHRTFHSIPWSLVFTVYLWFVWKWRCKVVFEQNFSTPPNSRQIIMNYAMDWFTVCNHTPDLVVKHLVHLHWTAPKCGICKINTDGSRKTETGCIGAGGILRDSTGKWLNGFSVNLGIGTILEAELWGVFWGLKLAWDMGYRIVEVECDASYVVALLQNAPMSDHRLFSLLNCCHLKLHDDWICSLTHVYREQNRAADLLAAKSYDFHLGPHVFASEPAFLCTVLAADTSNVATPRLIPL
ncbi:hypothetical protein CerSpe_069760 [Prunus speciosa]